MSDLSNASRFSLATPQLPVHWYFDPEIYEIEKRVLFDAGPGYVGHELMVPNVGDYHTLEWLGNSKALVRNRHRIELLSNVCRHRQATILKGRGSAQNLVCPLHRWTYGLDGRLLGAPHFPDNPCLDLARTPLSQWNGMLFAGRRDVVVRGAPGAARGDQQRDGDGQIVVAAFLGEIGGREVDDDAARRQRQAQRADGGAHALAAFADGLVGQADDIEVRQAAAEMDLDIDGDDIDPLKRHRVDPRDHANALDRPRRGRL